MSTLNEALSQYVTVRRAPGILPHHHAAGAPVGDHASRSPTCDMGAPPIDGETIRPLAQRL